MRTPKGSEDDSKTILGPDFHVYLLKSTKFVLNTAQKTNVLKSTSQNVQLESCEGVFLSIFTCMARFVFAKATAIKMGLRTISAEVFKASS